MLRVAFLGLFSFAVLTAGTVTAYGADEPCFEAKAECLEYVRELAEQGDAEEQANLGWMYYVGEGVEQDYQEAVRWYRLAAEQGDANAQFNLGQLYRKGEGVVTDGREAMRWFRAAAEQGDADAQYNLGVSYSRGDVVEEDKDEAMRWFQMASEQGHAKAQHSLDKKNKSDRIFIGLLVLLFFGSVWNIRRRARKKK